MEMEIEVSVVPVRWIEIGGYHEQGRKHHRVIDDADSSNYHQHQHHHLLLLLAY